MDDVEEHYKRFETYVDAKATETLIGSFLALSAKALGIVVKLKHVDALQNELKAVISSLKSYLLGRGGLHCDKAGCSSSSTRRQLPQNISILPTLL